MVKRILSITLLITLLLSFSACTRPAEDVGGADAPKVSQTAGESETTTEPTTTTIEPTTTPTTTTPTTPSGSAYPRADGKLTNAEKAAFNKELNFTFYRPFTQMIPDGVETLVFDTDLFATAEGRIRYAWQSAIGEETVSYIDELRADGEGETGALAMKEADFVAFYERLFGKKADMTVLARVHPEFTLRDGYIYGYHITGWGLPSFVLKAVSFKDTGTDRCVLTMDLLTSFTVVTSNGKTYADVDEEFILEYASETVLTYPAEAVYARVTLNLLASEEGYVLQNLHVTQERAANTSTPTTPTTTTAAPSTTTTRAPTTKVPTTTTKPTTTTGAPSTTTTTAPTTKAPTTTTKPTATTGAPSTTTTTAPTTTTTTAPTTEPIPDPTTRPNGVFDMRNITRITLYAYYGMGTGADVPAENMAEIKNWLATFTLGERVGNDEIPPGTNTLCVEIAYANGTVIKEGLSIITVGGVKYYMESDNAPACFWDIISHTSIS